jgi:hypothetical protein
MDWMLTTPRRYFEIVGWDKAQTMDRPSAPWFKVYTSLMHNDDFEALDKDSRLLLLYLWMHAAIAGRAIFPDDPKWLFRKIHLLDQFPNLDPLAVPRRDGRCGWIRWCTIDGGPWQAPGAVEGAAGTNGTQNVATAAGPGGSDAGGAGHAPGQPPMPRESVLRSLLSPPAGPTTHAGPTPWTDPGADNRAHLPEERGEEREREEGVGGEERESREQRAERESREKRERAEIKLQGKTADGFPQRSLAAQAAEGECREGKSQSEEPQAVPARVMRSDVPLPPIVAVPFVPLGADGLYGKGSGPAFTGLSAGGRAGDARMLGQCWPKGIEALLDPLKGEWVAAVYQRLGFPWPIDSAIGRREAGCFASLYDGLMTTRLPDPIKRLILAHDLDWAEKNGRQKRSRKRGAVFAAVHQKRLRQYLSRDGPRR